MSKQSEAKKSQGYNPKGNTCSNCRSFQSKIGANEWGGVKERELRCSVGGFAVKKTATCKNHILVNC